MQEPINCTTKELSTTKKKHAAAERLRCRQTESRLGGVADGLAGRLDGHRLRLRNDLSKHRGLARTPGHVVCKRTGRASYEKTRTPRKPPEGNRKRSGAALRGHGV